MSEPAMAISAVADLAQAIRSEIGKAVVGLDGTGNGSRRLNQ